jgi:hypothetical protein
MPAGDRAAHGTWLAAAAMRGGRPGDAPPGVPVEGRGWNMPSEMDASYPQCNKCSNGRMLPLSDYGRDGAPITFKAWVCSNPECGFNIRIDNGEISFGRTISQSYK